MRFWACSCEIIACKAGYSTSFRVHASPLLPPDLTQAPLAPDSCHMAVLSSTPWQCSAAGSLNETRARGSVTAATVAASGASSGAISAGVPVTTASGVATVASATTFSDTAGSTMSDVGSTVEAGSTAAVVAPIGKWAAYVVRNIAPPTMVDLPNFARPVLQVAPWSTTRPNDEVRLTTRGTMFKSPPHASLPSIAAGGPVMLHQAPLPLQLAVPFVAGTAA
mmetsp:Transcript_87675/g.246298  ORF Transcript_87675/g.246298 Transcript_87675/m.246298 type:complete len:222 (-) Transcript_87675:13-678(-)